MRTLVVSSLALCAAAPGALAGESEEWVSLDQEIEALGTALPQGGTGLALSGFLRTAYWNSSSPFDGSAINPAGDDISGFTLDNARVNLDGSVGNFDVHLALEGNATSTGFPGSGPGFYRIPGTGYGVQVLDAYSDWNITDAWYVRAGLFRAAFLREALLDENELIFWQKSVMADTWSSRDEGVMLGGSFGMISLHATIQNGSDYVADELAFALRGDWNILGGGAPDSEGAYEASADTGLHAGVAYYDDGSITDGNAVAVDAAFTMGPFAAQGCFVSNSDGLGVTTPAGFTGGTTSWDLDASFLFAGTWEVAARYQDLDDVDNSAVIDIALNKYMEGHDAKFLLQYSNGSSDDAVNEADLLILGMTVSV